MRGVKAARTLFTSRSKSGIGVDVNRSAAGQRDEVRIHDEVGIEDDHLVAGIDGAAQREQQAAAGAAGDDHLAIGVSVGLADIGQNLGPQLRNALGDGVGVVALVDGGTGGGLDRLGHVEVRLADAQVDGVLEAASQLENLADARRLDMLHAVGDPAVVHER